MKSRLLVLRHAQTAVPDRFHGAESDIGLGDLGLEQARNVADRIAMIEPKAIYSSAMRRARETAQPIASACGLPSTSIAALHERKMGPLSGTPWVESYPIYEETMRRWMSGDLDATHAGGESYAQIRSRVVPEFLAIAARHAEETVVVVAHGVVIRVLITSLVDGLGPEDLRLVPIEFVGIHDLRCDGALWSLVVESADGPAGSSDEK
ncbi:MAG: fructose-2,6-bisphosphatase [Planctomycetota bacterium]|nr:fructose-2,6-bisphosphatase [Planctomycetota bacterium]